MPCLAKEAFRKRNTSHWSGSDGSCAQLYVLVGLKNTYEVGIAISGPSDRVKPSSGSKDLTPVLEKFPLGNTP